MMMVQFETRAGQKFVGEMVSLASDTRGIQITKGGGKSFVGKMIVFKKSDMINFKIVDK